MDKINNSNDFSEGTNSEKSKKLTSQRLAALIIDAITDAGLIDKRNVQLAIDIAAEEIDIRKALGDY